MAIERAEYCLFTSEFSIQLAVLCALVLLIVLDLYTVIASRASKGVNEEKYGSERGGNNFSHLPAKMSSSPS